MDRYDKPIIPALREQKQDRTICQAQGQLWLHRKIMNQEIIF